MTFIDLFHPYYIVFFRNGQAYIDIYFQILSLLIANRA